MFHDEVSFKVAWEKWFADTAMYSSATVPMKHPFWVFTYNLQDAVLKQQVVHWIFKYPHIPNQIGVWEMGLVSHLTGVKHTLPPGLPTKRYMAWWIQWYKENYTKEEPCDVAHT